jgi:3-mercaptopyruvate sulfurtransferase SseA
LYVKANYRNYTGILLSGGIISCSVTPRTESQKISKLVNDDRTFLVDVRTPEEYNAEKIEGAVNIRWIRLKTDYLNFKVKRI